MSDGNTDISTLTTQRLPVVGSDVNTWGGILNGFVSLEHNSDGTHTYPGPFNVKRFGAKGDGTTDDSAAILAAAAAADPVNGVLLFPAATYAVAVTLSLAAYPGITLSGYGAVLKLTTSQVTFITLGNNQTWQGLTIDANHLASSNLMTAASTDGCVVEECTLKNVDTASGVAVNLNSTTHFRISNCILDTVRTGFSINSGGTNNADQIVIEGCWIKNWTQRGIYMVATGAYAASNLTIRNNRITDMISTVTADARSPMWWTATGTARFTNHKVIGNTIIGNNASYLATVAPLGTSDQISPHEVDGLIVAHNTSLYGGDVGISGPDNTAVTIHGNFCAFNDSQGIDVGTNAAIPNINGATVTGNVCMNNIQNRGGLRNFATVGAAGISVLKGINVVVTSNVCTDTQSVPTQTVGISAINCPGPVTCSNNIASVINGTVTPYFDAGGNTSGGLTFIPLPSGTTLYGSSTPINATGSPTAFGYQALQHATTGGGNTAVGIAAAAALTTAGDVTAIGWGAGTLTNGGYSTHVGAYAGWQDTGSFNTYVGARTGMGNNGNTPPTTGTGNTGVGYEACGNGGTYAYQTAIGWEAGGGRGPAIAVTGCTFAGTTITLTLASVAQLVTGGQLIVAGITGFTTNNPNGIYFCTGVNSGALQVTYNVTTAPTGTYASGGTVIGGSSNAQYCCWLGGYAGALNQLGNANVGIGYQALYNVNAGNNTAVGHVALNYLTTGIGNVAVGLQSLQYATTCQYNVAIGQSAGLTGTTANATITGGYNVFVGYQSGPASADDPNHSTAVGQSAAAENSAAAFGSNAKASNTFATAIGPSTVASAVGSVAIGTDSTGAGASATLGNQFSLGTALHLVKFSNNTTGAGSAALGANCPAVTATAPYTWIKLYAGDNSTVYVPAWK